ncbi:SMI1/KNR4 family protein [Streptomyces sp. AC550_RSS872]|uniref:SMI1/KNR4 family protein n=1 Tax=Streptomyces sp. AC550_RSS872 TaxID=2823689 RepID=UPI001C27C46D|nr:SMI1/KNR4 family protein [Streptomyces sp. AC550_RSS872]
MTENEQLLTSVADKARNLRPWGWTSLPESVDAATPARAEAALGFPLPPLLADLYLRIGDGGFGPEYGLLALLDSPPAGEPAAVTQYLANRESGREDPDWPWPEGVLPISHWGCAMYACVDCHSSQATVLLSDGTGWYEEMNDDVEPTPRTDFRIRTAKAPGKGA